MDKNDFTAWHGMAKAFALGGPRINSLSANIKMMMALTSVFSYRWGISR